ncbi:heavy-metal-associated domain-containing protein [Nocardia gipuzkoensis]|uniref:heavy-metal-associated domain-containing protein n=1 Tax=Nocardia gipuzkoensis TaxID=2749991 RepID=UPI001E42FFD8|nr:heavy metal-associated domain-containing protein [Nocardia gipuzkoensis]UGT70906.1 heavy-metal-associated domain-containing protein [Nocardia gipuzkoensis]
MATSTHELRIEGMHCGSCALLIDDTLEDLPGVHRARTTMKNRRSIVELDPSTTDIADILAAVEKLGYTATLAS